MAYLYVVCKFHWLFFLVTLPVPVVNALNATAMAPCHSMSIIMIIIMIIMIMIILISIADYVKT